MASEPFLIAGGGIAGLAAALGLARIGQRATVLEQAPAFEETGAGLQLGPNAVKALKYLGAWDTVVPSTFAPQQIVVRDGHSGILLQEIRLGGEFEARFGEPYRVVHRADLLAGLLVAAHRSRAIALKPGKRLIGFTEIEQRVIAETAGSETFEGAALIGADGLRSLVRQSVVGDGPPRLSGQVLFRALVPISEASASLDRGAVTLWLCRGAHLVHYPVRTGTMLNIVAAVDGAWNDESWSAVADPSELAGFFTGSDSTLAAVLAIPQSWAKWAGASRRPAARWSQRRISLIGDAAHPILPYLAQGAAMALEDATVLAAALSERRTIADAFKAYENARHARTARVMRASQRQARAYHASGLLRLGRNALLKRGNAGFFLSRLAWLYGWEPPLRC